MNKKENPGVSLTRAAMLLLFSLAVSVSASLASCHARARRGRWPDHPQHPCASASYPYTGYMDRCRSAAAAATPMSCCRTFAQHENVTFASPCLDGNTQQVIQQLAAGRST